MITKLKVSESFSDNTLPKLVNWDKNDSSVTISDDGLTIPAGAKAGVTITTIGLNSAHYRELKANIEGLIPDISRFKPVIDFYINFEYTSNNTTNRGRVSGAVTKLNLELIPESNSIYYFDKLLVCPRHDFVNATLYLKNNSDSPITLRACELRRSKDLSASQVSEDVSWSLTLSRLEAYKDGCKVYFEADETPLKLQWQENEQGQFTGVLVNDERFVAFVRRDEYLT